MQLDRQTDTQTSSSQFFSPHWDQSKNKMGNPLTQDTLKNGKSDFSQTIQ